MSDPILLNVTGEIAVITLNIPQKLNALTADLYLRLAQLLREVALMPEVLITVLTGKGRYFSAGADISAVNTGDAVRSEEKEMDVRTFYLRKFTANNLDVTRAFSTHPKLLITALNGPAVGLSAALIAHSDFIYATSTSFILTPFTSLGLVAEGASSHTFVQRLGLSKANEALIASRSIPAQELLHCGFVNRIYPAPAREGEFIDKVLRDVKDQFIKGEINRESMLLMKRLIRRQFEAKVEAANVEEVFGGLDRFVKGVPQQEFLKLARGGKRHKL